MKFKEKVKTKAINNFDKIIIGVGTVAALATGYVWGFMIGRYDI